MQIEDNRQIAAGFYEEVINKKNIDAIGDYLTDDFIHNGAQRGIEGQKQAIQMFFSAFSSLVNTIEFFLGEGDLICVHEAWTGVHTGEFMSVKPSGKNIKWTSTAILQIRDNKICQVWDENDFFRALPADWKASGNLRKTGVFTIKMLLISFYFKAYSYIFT